MEDTSRKGFGVGLAAGLAALLFGVPVAAVISGSVADSVCPYSCYGEEYGAPIVSFTFVALLVAVFLTSLVSVIRYARAVRRPAVLRGLGWTWWLAALPLAAFAFGPLVAWLCGPTSCNGDYMVMGIAAIIVDLMVLLFASIFAGAALAAGSRLRKAIDAEPDEVGPSHDEGVVLSPPSGR